MSSWEGREETGAQERGTSTTGQGLIEQTIAHNAQHPGAAEEIATGRPVVRVRSRSARAGRRVFTVYPGVELPDGEFVPGCEPIVFGGQGGIRVYRGDRGGNHESTARWVVSKVFPVTEEVPVLAGILT